MMFFNWYNDTIFYGDVTWPSYSYWMIPAALTAHQRSETDD